MQKDAGSTPVIRSHIIQNDSERTAVIDFQTISTKAQALSAESTGSVNVVSIAESMGAHCWVKPMDAGIMGFVVRHDQFSPQIYVNAGLRAHQRRFAIARSLGHLELAETGDDVFAIDRSPQSQSSADVFARALLMPERALSNLHSRRVDVTEMSLVFDVSGTNVQRRLEDLGIS